MKASQFLAAIGKEDGDYVELHNQWACVTISRDRCAEHQYPLKWVYTVSGDVADLRESTKTFRTQAQALAYAVESLALYQKGALR